MRSLWWLFAVCFFLAGCSRISAPAPPSAPQTTEEGQPILITRTGQLDGAVDQFVTIEGKVSPTKIPQILGVEVDAIGMAGRNARATGILKKWTVTQEDIERQTAERGVFSHRGPGTFYRLVRDGGEETAPAVPLP
jgi:hypothetical protein